MKGFYLLLRRALFLTTEDAGTHEITRLFVNVDGTCRTGDRLDRKIGPGVVKSVELDTQNGLFVETSRGTLWTPTQDCQLTYVPY